MKKEIAGLVTIIIPCFNYGNFLAEALGSIQRQAYPHFECLVVDDGSTDDTPGVVQRFAAGDSRIRYLGQKNQGQPQARNTGLEAARGQFIQFLDADDCIQSRKLFTQAHFLLDNPSVSAVYGEVRYFDSSPQAGLTVNRWGDASKEWMPKISGAGTSLAEAYAGQNIFELGAAIFRTALFDGNLRFRPDLQGVEDYELCFRLALSGIYFQFLAAPETQVFMRNHPGSFSKQQSRMYLQEMKMRWQLEKTLLRSPELLTTRVLNRKRFSFRLRQLQDKIIDQSLKEKNLAVERNTLRWMVKRSSLLENLYFLPRLAKAWVGIRFRPMR